MTERMQRPAHIENAPGLVWVERVQAGWHARWQARSDLVRRGYKPKRSEKHLHWRMMLWTHTGALACRSNRIGWPPLARKSAPPSRRQQSPKESEKND